MSAELLAELPQYPPKGGSVLRLKRTTLPQRF